MEIRTGSALTPPTADRVKWFEKAYRVTLPIDYVKFLEIGNGGVPVENVFDANGRKRVVESFLCILNDPQSDSVNAWRDTTVVISQLDERLVENENLIGINVIPIAILFGGDFLCLDFRRFPEAPTISLWDHEQSDEFKPHLEMVANSFTQLTSQLES